MSTVAAGSVIFMAHTPDSLIFRARRSAPPVAVARDVFNGMRLAFDIHGVLLSDCPSTALLESPPPPGEQTQILQLNDGRHVMIANNVANTYTAVGTRVRGRSFNLEPPITARQNAHVSLSGTNHIDTIFVAVASTEPAEAPFTRYLQAGTIHPVLALIEDLADVDSVASDANGQAPALYALCTDAAGKIYYIKGDNSDPLLSKHTLYRYDTTNPGVAHAVQEYLPGETYPLPNYMTTSFAFSDGSLCLVFGALYGSVLRQVKRIHQNTGEVIAAYLQTSDEAAVFEGLTDAEFWILLSGGHVILVNRFTGNIVATLDVVRPLGTVVGVYTLRTPYPACVEPPRARVTRYIRRVRRFRLPFQQNMFLYLNRFELLIQPGEAATTGQGSEPVIFARFSGDGGTTWGPTIRMPAGPLGDYGYRPVINQVGKFRDPMCEIWVSDPIYWYMIGCYIDGEFAPG